MSSLTSTPGRTLRLTCECELGAVRDAARAVRAFLERQGLPTADLDAWELICSEAGNNAVEHALVPAQRVPVEFVVEVNPGAVELRVVDHTAGFELPDTTELPEPLEEGGRGIFLMRTLSDSLNYVRGGTENWLVVRRQRPAAPGGQAVEDCTIGNDILEETLQTMTEELAASYESLSAIFRFTEDLFRSGGDDEFIARWLKELRQITEADWFVLRLHDRARGHLDVAKASSPNLDLAPLSLDALRAPEPPRHSVELAAVAGRQDIWFDADSPPSAEDPLCAAASALSGFCHPIFVTGELVGVLTVGRYARSHPFTAGQVNIIHTLSDFLGIQVRNAQIHRANLQAQLLERDYQVASRIQRQLLPKHHPRLGRWSTLGFCESAQSVGGDFYDILEVGSQGLLLAVADVMGKGLPAALFATVFRTLLRARPELARSPGPFVDWLNQNLVTELGGLEMFITAQLAYVNLSTRELRVAGAGHPPLLLAGKDHPGIQVASAGPPLGIADHMEFGEDRLILPPGTRLILYTDGVSEAADRQGRQVGMDPLLAILADSAARDEDIASTLSRLNRLQPAEGDGHPPADDRTLLLLAEDLRDGPP